MILRRLTLSNIRAYATTATLTFAPPGARNTTLIHGLNGAGKTTLFEALNWVLYGDIVKYPGHLLNESLLRSVGEGDTITGSVSLEFEDAGEKYFLSRGVVGALTGGEVSEKQSGVEMYTIDALGNSKLVKGGDQRILQMLPSAIRTFFFFDGDKIAEFTRPGKEQDRQITRAVNDVLHLELLNRASQHLGDIARQINKKIAERGTAEVKDLQARLERQLALRDQLAENRRLIVAELEDATVRKGQIDHRYRDIENVAKQAARRSQLETEVRVCASRVEAAKVGLMQANLAAFSLPMSGVLAEAEDLLEEKRKKGEIPSDYKDQFLLDLLEHHRCICDRDLRPGSDPYIRVEQLLQQVVPNGLQEKALLLHGEAKRLLKSHDACKAAMLRCMSDIDSAHKDLDALQHELDEVNAALGAESHTDVLELESQRLSLEAEIGKHRTSLGGLEVQIESARAAVERLEKEFHAESQRQQGLKTLTREAAIASRAGNEIAAIRERLIGELRTDLSSEATRIFKAFTWKTDFFERVEVGEDYLLQLFDVNGRDMRGVMSMGETQLLSLAFILAMTAISDHQAPLVIDTPLARLDRNVRLNLAAALPDLTSQLVLFVTDTEMTPEVRSSLADRVGAEYRLSFSDGISQIVDGGL